MSLSPIGPVLGSFIPDNNIAGSCIIMVRKGFISRGMVIQHESLYGGLELSSVSVRRNRTM